MQNNLLILSYPYEEEVFTSFQWAVSYDDAVPYEGDAEIVRNLPVLF